MALIGTLIDFQPLTQARSADVDANFEAIRSAFNTSAVLTDVAKTVTVTHTFNATQTFASGIDVTIVRRPTVNGSDDSALHLSGGGGDSAHTERGAGIVLYGNEHATSPAAAHIVAGDKAGGNVEFYTDAAVKRMTVNRGGVVSIGTTVIVGAAAGEVILGNDKGLRGVNFAGTGTGPIAKIGTSNQLTLGTGLVVAVGGAVVTGASPDDLVLGSTKALRFGNGAGTTALSALSMGSDNHLYVVFNGTSALVVGNPTTVAGAGAGEVVLGNAKALRFSNGAGTTTLPALSVDGANRTRLDLNGVALVFGNASYSVAALGAYNGKIQMEINGSTVYIPCYL